jgi:hypothetical protein
MGYLLDLLDDASLKNQQEVVRNERRQRYDNVPYGATASPSPRRCTPRATPTAT